MESRIRSAGLRSLVKQAAEASEVEKLRQFRESGSSASPKADAGSGKSASSGK